MKALRLLFIFIFGVGFLSLVSLGNDSFGHFALAAAPSPSPYPSASHNPPKISDYVSQEMVAKVMASQKYESSAKLSAVHGPVVKNLEEYKVATLMLAPGDLAVTKRVLTDYKLYQELVPFIERSKWDPKTETLALEGGIWNWKMISYLKFTPMHERWIKFKIVAGHFRGMEGDFLFEPAGEGHTLVLMRAEQRATWFPPAFVLEMGAKTVFEWTAQQMRDYIIKCQKPDFVERNQTTPSHMSGDGQKGNTRDSRETLPQPRSGLFN